MERFRTTYPSALPSSYLRRHIASQGVGVASDGSHDDAPVSISRTASAQWQRLLPHCQLVLMARTSKL
eukprot:1143520-Pelagomonas_calceolata.AAC.4